MAEEKKQIYYFHCYSVQIFRTFFLFVCLLFFHILARIFICLPLLVVQPYIVRNTINDVTDELTCS